MILICARVLLLIYHAVLISLSIKNKFGSKSENSLATLLEKHLSLFNLQIAYPCIGAWL